MSKRWYFHMGTHSYYTAVSSPSLTYFIIIILSLNNNKMKQNQLVFCIIQYYCILSKMITLKSFPLLMVLGIHSYYTAVSPPLSSVRSIIVSLSYPQCLVPEFYVRSTVAPGHTGQCLLKTCGIDSVSKLEYFCNKK